MENEYNGEPLIDPALLKTLPKAERKHALAAAKAAKRAEERAEQRALERAMEQRAVQRKAQEAEEAHRRRQAEQSTGNLKASNSQKISFVSRKDRLKQKQVGGADKEQDKQTQASASKASSKANDGRSRGDAGRGSSQSGSRGGGGNGRQRDRQYGSNSHNSRMRQSEQSWHDKEMKQVKEEYLGKTSKYAREQEEAEAKRKATQKKTKHKKTFKFRWDNTEDTLDHNDPLYATVPPRQKRGRDSHRDAPWQGRDRNDARRRGNARKKRSKMDLDSMDDGSNFMKKPISKMTTRDWRIFRENYEIVVKGGKTPPPLRFFDEPSAPNQPKLNPRLLDAIRNVMRYKEPTPIQRQAIPIGLQRRDLIGIAMTGSGKTAAFGIPLLHYMLNLPSKVLNRVAEDGPLALVVAPTRELALQIHGEFEKLLSRQGLIKTAAVVGGQPIQQQATVLRGGVHVVVGTPGRMNDCIDMAYMVLNQCCYIVLDEADRMIDMGFAPQMQTILDAMGGMLKSEDATEAYKQEEEDMKRLGEALPKHRVTAMFSATMPLEVEKLAKQYLRHPAVISIGDQDSVKNARIHQKILFLSSPSKKEAALREQVMMPRFLREKVIVFVNEKKHADGIGRMVERFGRTCVVLHGGKSQEQREENLETFRKGGIVLVATDVAGRGLDIPDVAHVINYDVPSRSIDSYNHRIGRTGRAGKEGYATSFITDEDTGIMAPLKAYLESTGNPVPERLARHPAASANGGDDDVLY